MDTPTWTSKYALSWRKFRSIVVVMESFRNITWFLLFTQYTFRTKLNNFVSAQSIVVFVDITISSRNATIGTVALRIVHGHFFAFFYESIPTTSRSGGKTCIVFELNLNYDDKGGKKWWLGPIAAVYLSKECLRLLWTLISFKNCSFLLLVSLVSRGKLSFFQDITGCYLIITVGHDHGAGIGQSIQPLGKGLESLLRRE